MANLFSLAADLRTAQPRNTVPPHFNLSKEEQQAVADCATFAAKYHGRWGGLAAFPPSWIQLALATEGVSDQAVWSFFDDARCISNLYAHRVGFAVTVYKVKQRCWREPTKGWYSDCTQIQYGGVVDQETFESKWAVNDAGEVSLCQKATM
ncbi:hypothetical protein P3342_002724 [Pyrenophora teres f. teres]|nr:hypothetical protein P3342_002724 [Pyrenophora teres f. teres]